jgi:hypothetical protein
LHGHAGSGENGRAAHDFRIGLEDFRQLVFAHADKLTSSQRAGKQRLARLGCVATV